MLFPNWLVVWFSTAGIGAFVLGARSAGTLLLTPAIIRFGMLPLLPAVPEGAAQVTLMTLAPLVAIFGAILLLQKSVSAVYGRDAAGYVAGTYLVRVFDGVGGLLGLVVLAGLIAWVWPLIS